VGPLFSHEPQPVKSHGRAPCRKVAELGVLAFAGLNIRSYAFAGPATPIANANLQRVVISVEGMTCATCEIVVRHALRRIEGVKSVDVSAAVKTATVDYEPVKANPQKLVEAINSTGYHASVPDK
jgi:copper chaperone CopZ